MKVQYIWCTELFQIRILDICIQREISFTSNIPINIPIEFSIGPINKTVATYTSHSGKLVQAFTSAGIKKKETLAN